MGEADGLSRVIADSSVDDFEDPEVALCLVITRRRSRIGEKSVIWSFARPSRGSNPHFRFSAFSDFSGFGFGVGLLAASDFAPRSPIFLEPSSRHGRCAIFVQHLTCQKLHRSAGCEYQPWLCLLFALNVDLSLHGLRLVLLRQSIPALSNRYRA